MDAKDALGLLLAWYGTQSSTLSLFLLVWNHLQHVFCDDSVCVLHSAAHTEEGQLRSCAYAKLIVYSACSVRLLNLVTLSVKVNMQLSTV